MAELTSSPTLRGASPEPGGAAASTTAPFTPARSAGSGRSPRAAAPCSPDGGGCPGSLCLGQDSARPPRDAAGRLPYRYEGVLSGSPGRPLRRPGAGIAQVGGNIYLSGRARP